MEVPVGDGTGWEASQSVFCTVLCARVAESQLCQRDRVRDAGRAMPARKQTAQTAPTAKASRIIERTAIPTRERIRAIAEDLYVLRGHDGFSFGDIAAEIGTTRA